MPSHAYTYHSPHTEPLPSSSPPRRTLPSSSPRRNLPSLPSCLKYYGLMLGSLGMLASFLWVCLHLFVLSQTENPDLRLSRYLEIGLGLLMFISCVCLVYGGFVESRTWLTVFSTGSMLVLLSYWGWFFWDKYAEEHPESNSQRETVGVVLTVVYSLMMIPICVYYRSLEKKEVSHRPSQVHQPCTGGGGCCSSECKNGPESNMSKSYNYKEKYSEKFSCIHSKEDLDVPA